MARGLRETIDRVIDTPSTGRRTFDDLEKTERTYLGTKVELLLRRRTGFPRGHTMDLNINGQEVDIKFTTSGAWMIPPEAVGKLMLVIAADDANGRFWMGLVKADSQKLRGGGNRDKKTSLSAEGLRNIRWLVSDRAYEPNFWQGIPQDIIDHVFDPSIGGTRRIMRLFHSLPRHIIPRKVVEDVAQQLDFTRRIRANGGARDLSDGKIVILSDLANDAIEALGLPVLPKGAYMAIDIRTSIEANIIKESIFNRNRKLFGRNFSTPAGIQSLKDQPDDLMRTPDFLSQEGSFRRR